MAIRHNFGIYGVLWAQYIRTTTTKQNKTTTTIIIIIIKFAGTT